MSAVRRARIVGGYVVEERTACLCLGWVVVLDEDVATDDLFVELGVGPTMVLLWVRGWMVRGTLHHPIQVPHFVAEVARAY